MKTVSQKLAIVNNYIESAAVPIEVVNLAQRLGLRVYNAPWPDTVSGKIQRDSRHGGESGFAIFVNQNHSHVRRRFTIAHEIGHYVLHEAQIGDGIFDDAMYRSGLSNAIEAQANRMAADILMPRSLLDRYVKVNGNDPSVLAGAFDVSEQAMKIRLGLNT